MQHLEGYVKLFYKYGIVKEITMTKEKNLYSFHISSVSWLFISVVRLFMTSERNKNVKNYLEIRGTKPCLQLHMI